MLAVDPTSPFSGGAILGDRVRMQSHTTDPGVFIRSMATRGHLGGLALATPQAVRVLDAVGKAWIVIETVGVGQVEVEIAGHADTTVVVVNPGWGDSVQTAKAGLMEIADVFVVNKADRPGAAETESDLVGMLELSSRRSWRPPIVRTVATTGEGDRRVVRCDCLATRRISRATGDADERRKARLREELRGLVGAEMLERAASLSRAPLRGDRRRGCRPHPGSLLRRGRVVGGVTPHLLRVRLDDAAAGRFPPADGLVEVVASPGGPADAIVGFTGHFVVAADIDPDEFAAHVPPGDLARPMSPASLLWLGARLGSTATTYDALLCGIGTGMGVPPWLHEVDGYDHTRVEEAARYRDDMRVFVADDDAAVLALGRGCAGVGTSASRSRRRRKVADWVDGWGRPLGLVPAGVPLWAQVVPGNAASLRAVLAAGFVPVGAEMLFPRARA